MHIYSKCSINVSYDYEGSRHQTPGLLYLTDQYITANTEFSFFFKLLRKALF